MCIPDARHNARQVVQRLYQILPLEWKALLQRASTVWHRPPDTETGVLALELEGMG